jgi:adenine-specific DNA-methyltransferase
MTIVLNRIIHGDCVEVLRGMAAESVDFVLTDAPYVKRYAARDGRTVPNDGFTWLKPAYAELYRVLKPDSFCVSFYGWAHIDKFATAFRDAGFRFLGHLAFPKQYVSGKRYLSYQHESACLLVKGDPPEPEDALRDVIAWTDFTGNKLHPTEKPLAILKPLIEAFLPGGRCRARPVQRIRIDAACRETARPRVSRHRARCKVPRDCKSSIGVMPVRITIALSFAKSLPGEAGSGLDSV